MTLHTIFSVVSVTHIDAKKLDKMILKRDASFDWKYRHPFMSNLFLIKLTQMLVYGKISALIKLM